MERAVGEIRYTLLRKRVKNINLRIKEDLSVQVSASPRIGVQAIDAFVLSKAAWIASAKEKMRNRSVGARETFLDRWTNEECLTAFNEVSDRIYPLFARILKNKPLLKVRLMKTRWGVCHISKRTITLNKRLMEKPAEALEYVVLHEYVHFLHPDHQKGFHAEMRCLMPDYKERRKLLREKLR